MNKTFFSLKEKIFQIRLGKILLVVWMSNRWRAALHVGHRRFAN
jgi:hypothetical protein